MIIPSIDIQNGRVVQLRRGREFVLDGGDPLDRLEEMAVVGEVAVVDLDAAMGTGNNTALIRDMVHRAPCRIGGGIRTKAGAIDWLNAGAKKIVIGTAATPEFFDGLPRDRTIAAVDANHDEVVVEGWRSGTGVDPISRIKVLAPHVGGFLLTQVQHEGGMAGFDWDIIEEARHAAPTLGLTAAGGITTAEEIARLDEKGVDGQVGMALYTDHMTLGEAVGAPLRKDINGLWPTVVCDEHGAALGLVWSNRESLAQAVSQRRGVYWSRSRDRIWVKGETSGNTQTLLRVDLDCDRDALRFIVRQCGDGFCHTGSRACWDDRFTLSSLISTIESRKLSADPESRTARLFSEPTLLGSKLLEEARELADARTPDHVAHEVADVLYFAMTAMVRAGVSLEAVERELERRNDNVVRRPLAAKPETSDD